MCRLGPGDVLAQVAVAALGGSCMELYDICNPSVCAFVRSVTGCRVCRLGPGEVLAQVAVAALGGSCLELYEALFEELQPLVDDYAGRPKLSSSCQV